MLSPFPGMDPYLEAPEHWQDVHADLAAEIRTALNRLIQPRYFARMNSSLVYEEVEVGRLRGALPDVAVTQPQPPRTEMGTALATRPSTPVASRVPIQLPIRQYRVEIRTTGVEALVSVIEILSRVNKRPGHQAYRAYRRKRQALLRSSVHLIEIDLLRVGERPPLEGEVLPAPYYVMLSRAEDRPDVQLWPVQLAEPLPVVPVPLLEPDPDVSLDLNVVVASVYDRGAYAGQIDYSQPPPPPALSTAEAALLATLLRAYRTGAETRAENPDPAWPNRSTRLPKS
jgi:hypothetical protein